jgi:hypothetical protein
MKTNDTRKPFSAGSSFSRNLIMALPPSFVLKSVESDRSRRGVIGVWLGRSGGNYWITWATRLGVKR